MQYGFKEYDICYNLHYACDRDILTNHNFFNSMLIRLLYFHSYIHETLRLKTSDFYNI